MRLHANHLFILTYKAKTWQDYELILETEESWDISNITFTAAILLEGDACHMRFAMGQDLNDKSYAAVAEWRCALSPGLNLFRFTVEDLIALHGDVDFRSVNHVSFGGSAAYCRIVAQFCELKP